MKYAAVCTELHCNEEKGAGSLVDEQGGGVGRLALQAGTEVGGLRAGVPDRLCLFPLTKIQEAPVT